MTEAELREGKITETLIVGLDHPGEESWALKPRTINGKELQNWQQGPSLHEFLKQMRSQGWHFASGHRSKIEFSREQKAEN